MTFKLAYFEIIRMNIFPKPIRWGFIGCGSVTEIKSGPAYQKTEGFEVVAVMRRNLDKARDYAERHGIPKCYNEAAQLIHDDEVNAVYIATPPDSHKAYALQVAAAGKPCCIEKPMAPDYSDCLEIVAAFEERSLPLFVAYYRRSLPRFNQVRQWLEKGEIGAVRQVEWHLARPPYPRDYENTYNWRTDPAVAAGGYFDDLASHGLDLIAYLLGQISQASGHSLNQQGRYQAKDAVAASWRHASGVMGSGYWNFGCFSDEDKASIYGSAGKIEFSVFKNEPLALINEAGRKEIFIENPKHIQLYHVRNMRDHLLGLSRHPSTGITASHTAWVMDKILENYRNAPAVL